MRVRPPPRPLLPARRRAWRRPGGLGPVLPGSATNTAGAALAGGPGSLPAATVKGLGERLSGDDEQRLAQCLLVHLDAQARPIWYQAVAAGRAWLVTGNVLQGPVVHKRCCIERVARR